MWLKGPKCWWWYHQGKGGGLTATAAADVDGGAPTRVPYLRWRGVGAPLGDSSSPTLYEPWSGEGRGGSPPFLRLDGGWTGEAVALWLATGCPPDVVGVGGRRRRSPIEGSLSSPTRGSTGSPLCLVNCQLTGQQD
ncbi:hypothetical protein Sjap_013054 [Stephania japonica]|uniref:Uncharacterized protein n=1 Tax=Stephania japonica TaxID=461633 RepID=A0AAP0IZ59_9MAGN